MRSRILIGLGVLAGVAGGGVVTSALGDGGDQRPTRLTAPISRVPSTLAEPGGAAHSPAAPAPAPSRRSRRERATAAARGAIDPRRLIIRFEAGVSAAERAEARSATGARLERVLAPENAEVWRVPAGRDVERVIAGYRHDPRVALAAPNRRYSISATPNDPGFIQQWGLDNSGQSGYLGDGLQGAGTADQDIDAPEAFGTMGLGSFTGAWPASNFSVAIVDTGVYAQHPDLAGKVLPCASALTGSGTLASGFCADDNGHGTHVSGIAAATANNGIGISGVAPTARIYMCKALDAGGGGYEADIAACINDAVAHRDQYGIRVLSLSFGGDDSPIMKAAVDHAWDQGLLVVAAAGNEFKKGNPLDYPAAYDSAVSVAADDRRGQRATFSEVNDDVEISAPGMDILSTVPTYPTDPLDGVWAANGYAYLDGTSMATPVVAAVAATIAAVHPAFSAQQLRDALDASVDDLGAAGRDPQFGFGRVNLAKAPIAPPPPPPPVKPPVTPPVTTPNRPTTSSSFGLRPSGYSILAGRTVAGRGQLGRLSRDDGRRFEVAGSHRGRHWISDVWFTTSLKLRPQTRLKRIGLVVDGNVSRAGASRRITIYDWTAKRWVTLSLIRHARSSDRRTRWSSTVRPARFVSPGASVRIRLTVTGTSSVRARTDYLEVTFGY